MNNPNIKIFNRKTKKKVQRILNTLDPDKIHCYLCGKWGKRATDFKICNSGKWGKRTTDFKICNKCYLKYVKLELGV